MAELTLEQKRAIANARARQRLQQQQAIAQPDTAVEYKRILPFREDAEGWHFDSNAGILGAAKRAVMLPGQVYRGDVDPMSDEGIDRAIEASFLMTPGSAATRAGVGFMGAPITKRARVAPPSAQTLDAAGRAGFKAMRKTGAEYPSAAVRNMANRVRAELETDGILEELAPKAFKTLKKLESPPPNSVSTITNLASARQALRNAGKDFNNTIEQKAARRILSGIDGLIEAGGTGSSVARFPARGEAARLLKEANANYGAAKRSSRLTGVERAADIRAAAANSGQNTGNAIRQRVASVLLSPKQIAGYSPAEVKALEGVVQGSLAANSTRRLGNMMGGGGGIASLLSGTAGSVPGLVFRDPSLTALGAAGVPAAGFMLKGASNALTRQALKEADQLVRSRSALHQRMLRTAPIQQYTPGSREALIRALLLQQAQQQASTLTSDSGTVY